MSSKIHNKVTRENSVQYKLEVLPDGRSIRHVIPYIQEFNTFAKGRWIGRELLEVLTRKTLLNSPFGNIFLVIIYVS